jgi:hypothetical protein
MDVVWQDNAPSFLDGSSPGAGGYAASLGDVGAPWFDSADGGGFSGQPVVWWDNGADSAVGRTSGFSLGAPSEMDGLTGRFAWIANGSDTLFYASALDGGLLWADPSSTSSWVPYGAGAAQFDLAGGGPSPWQQLLSLAGADTWFHETTNLLWAGGSGQPLVIPPIAGGSQLTNLHDVGSSQGWSFPTLTSQPLVWTELVNGVATPLTNPTQTGVAPLNQLFARP